MNLQNQTCNACRLSLQRKKVVNGTGKFYEPKLFIVGEAPGREEDDSGQPFVGGAGKVLNALLRDAGVSRYDCFVTNTARCRPPNNRVPEMDELTACQGYLRAEIDSIKPRLLVALGDTAAAFLAGKTVSTWRGSIVDGIGAASGYRVGITYHPAFVMRQRAMFPVVAWDLRKFAQTECTTEPLVQYNYTPSRTYIQHVFENIRKLNLDVAVDIETSADKEEGNDKDALNPFKGEIIGIAFAWGRGQALQMDMSTMLQNWDLVNDFLSTYPRQVYANNTFDRLFLWRQKDCRPQHYWDVQTAMHLIYPFVPKKLDFLRSVYTCMPPYKQVYKEAAGGKYRPGLLSPEHLADLNCKDVDVTWQVCQEQKKYVSEKFMQWAWQQEECALDMKMRGVFIDKRNLTIHYAGLLPTLEAFEKKYNEAYGVSISSPMQLKSLLHDRLQLPCFDDKGHLTNRKTASTNEKSLQALGSHLGLVYVDDEDGERFEGEHSAKEVLADILSYRGYAKIASTYCEGTFKSIQSDGRVHPEWRVNGTPTGRWSCSGVPFQGFPKDLRNMVRASEGNILFGADYKGMQILGAGILAGDEELCTLMQDPNYSLHNQVLEAIKAYYPSIRKILAKAVVFGKFFGRSDRDIAITFHVPVKVVNEWTDIFYALRPKLRTLLEEVYPAQWKDLGHVLGVDGHKLFAEKETEAKCYPVQNFEARVVKTAMWKLREAGFNLILDIHDQLVCEEPDDNTKEKRFEEFCHIMRTARQDLYPNFPIDAKMGYYWSEV